MNRLPASLLLLLAPLLAFAADEAPVEHASGFAVAVFAVLFFGGIVGYGVYVWWQARGTKKPGEE